jgi:multiple sugar transport system ATP-binding protein
MAYFEIDRLSKSFGKSKIIDNLSLSVRQGESVVVFGPSGCGKTVLLRLISGVLRADAGDIRIGGESIAHLGPEQRDVAMAFQNFALYPHMTAFENIASPLRARKTAEAEISRRVHELAELLRIDHVLGHTPRELSNGQKQRTSLARSLAAPPAVLLLDDPLRNVDAKIRYEMRLELPRVLREYRSTVFYVTQDYKEAMALGNRVGVLYDGTFQQVDTPAGIYGRPESIRIARLFGDPPVNLLPARPELGGDGRAMLRIGDSDLVGPPSLKSLVGRDLLVGIRPEDIEVLTEPSDGAIAVELDALTPLNVRAVMLLRDGQGTEILASCPEDDRPPLSRGRRQVWARLDLGRALFFDRATEMRIH